MRILTRSQPYKTRTINAFARWLGGCVHCGQSGKPSAFSPRLCQACATKIEGDMAMQYRCHTCACALPTHNASCVHCLMHPPLNSHCTTFADYASVMQYMILAYKFHHNLSYAPLLADILTATLSRHPIEYDVLIAVPQHEQTTRERGFVPLQFILDNTITPQYDSSAAIRLSHHLQVGLDAAQRQRQIKGAFAVTRDLSGLSVLLIDDVYTTGATLTELARVCLAAGAKQVSYAVLTRSRLVK